MEFEFYCPKLLLWHHWWFNTPQGVSHDEVHGNGLHQSLSYRAPLMFAVRHCTHDLSFSASRIAMSKMKRLIVFPASCTPRKLHIQCWPAKTVQVNTSQSWAIRSSLIIWHNWQHMSWTVWSHKECTGSVSYSTGDPKGQKRAAPAVKLEAS